MKVHFYPFAVIAFLLLFSIAPGGDTFGQNPFITVWKTDNPGITSNQEIRIPATGSFTYSWADINNPGSIGSGSGMDATTITFPQVGTYEVQMTPTGSPAFDEIRFFQFSGSDKAKLLEVKSWGSVQWTKFQFNDCPNLKVTATDLPDLSNVTDLSYAFSHCGIDTVPNIELWDVSNVTNFTNLFESANGFNQSLAAWDVSQAIDMGFMFDSAISFNQPLDTWDVSNVINMSYMFRDALAFDQSMPSWNLSSLQGAVGWVVRTSMSCENYSYTIHGWANNPNTASNLTFGAFQVEYSPDVLPARNFLIDSLNWNFQSEDSLGTCNVALGVDFKAFAVRLEQGRGVLSWVTASEVNNRGFEIQRSADGSSWKTIGYKASSAAGGNSTQPEEYHFYDVNPLAGANYYRLKQIDLDGRFVYSGIKMLVVDARGSSVEVYPNPTTNKVTVSGLLTDQTIQLFDIHGKALQRPVTAQGERMTIDLSRATPGVYQVRITSPSGQVISRSVLKL